MSVVITVTSDWRWVFVYAATSLALLAWILTYKSFSIRLARRYLAWKGLGRGLRQPKTTPSGPLG